MGNLGNLMKQAMEAQKKAEQLKEELANVRIDAEAAGGLVKVVVNGVSELLEITIDGAKLGLEPDDVELLQDAIMAAMHDGARQAQDGQPRAEQSGPRAQASGPRQAADRPALSRRSRRLLAAPGPRSRRASGRILRRPQQRFRVHADHRTSRKHPYRPASRHTFRAAKLLGLY